MMKVKLSAGEGACRKILNISVPADMISPEYDNVVSAYAKTAKIKGFRPGKAPLDVIERHYAKEIEEESKSRLLPRFYHDALKKEDIQPVAVIDVQDVSFDRGNGMTFNVTVDLAPCFKLPRYKKITVKQNEVNITEKDVEDSMQRIMDQSARFEDVTTSRPVKEDDLLLIDYCGEIDGKAVKEIASDCAGLGEGKDFWVLLGRQDFLPGFSAELKGMAVDEKKTIKVCFPDKYHVASIAGKDALYNVHVKKIREKIMPELNEKFLKEFEVDSEQALREKVRQKLKENAMAQEKERMRGEIASFLREKISMELPVSIVNQETQLAARNIISRMVEGGSSSEQLEKRREEIMTTAAKSSSERVKLSYILEKIADEEKIQVEENEIEDHIKGLSGYYGVSPEKLKAEIEKNDGMERLKKDVRGEKTLNFLLEHAKIKK